MPARSTSRDDVTAWMDAVDRVCAARRGVELALAALDRSVVAARGAGASWDELSFATGQARSTVRRWTADAAAQRPRRINRLLRNLDVPVQRCSSDS